jgi:hypothetical protein
MDWNGAFVQNLTYEHGIPGVVFNKEYFDSLHNT